MLKDSQNKQNNYFEIGVIDKNTNNLIKKYVTVLPIIKKEGIVHDKLMNLMFDIRGKDIIVLYNNVNGEMPNNIDFIDIDIPKEPELIYNR